METRDLCYWLQGHLEMNPDLKVLTPEQVKIVQNHLAMTMKHMDHTDHKPKPTTTVRC